MSITDNSGDRRGGFCTAVVACLFLVAGLVVLTLGFQETTDAERPVADSRPVISKPKHSAPSRRSTDRGTEAEFHAARLGSPPAAMAIPRIGVRATRFERLGLAPNGEIQVPRDADNPGWFSPGPAPGQFGPAVIAGHLDDQSGPAVFYRLSDLRPGDRVRVTPRRGPAKVFTVDRVVSFDKNAFPTKAVYGPTTRPELRLITCGGRYEQQDGYVRNTVVFAHLA